MKKLTLAAIGMYFSILCAFSQNISDSSYKPRKLKFEEANFVSSYYHQDGNNSAVTGGIGSEKLTDLSNSIDFTISGYDKRYRKHSSVFETGIDSYTSVSSHMIDAAPIT